MVWGLFPVDPLQGEHEYYIFEKGTFKVGRKGCDIIVNKDKGVSRVHAEIIVDEMICMDHLQKRHSNNFSKVHIRDCSKYGTFLNKNLGFKEKVHEFPNKETTLKDGDLVSFGTGNAKYRFSFVPLVLFASLSKPSEMSQLQEKMSTIGASVTPTWNSKCTHMVINDFISINNEIIDAIIARKPIVAFSWIQLISGKTICTEVPSCLSHAPTVLVQGVSVKITDPQSREPCLKGYTFLLESPHKYRFKEKLQLLLNVGGAKVVCIETSDPRSQNLGDNLVCVMPAGLSSSSGSFKNFNSLPKVNEMELIAAVVSGRLDPSILKAAPVVITSSCSTDETVVADSDAELETATSIRTSVAVDIIESAEDEHEKKIAVDEAEPSGNGYEAEKIVHVVESSEHETGENTASLQTIRHGGPGLLHPNEDSSKPGSSYKSGMKSDGVNLGLSGDSDEGMGTRKDKGHSSESDNLDIIYSQNLIVREPNLTQSGNSSRNSAVTDFKHFRKTSAPSGNSFNSLIPFSKQPYEESDYGNEDVSASIKEEKKRKQMEAIADDLFNNEKGRKRGGASGSLRGLFARG